MAQNRVYWAAEAVGFATLGSNIYTAAKGVQSCGITTAFNLTPVFELGQSAVYQLLEDIPDVQISMEKVLDGSPILYHLATKGSPSADLFGRSATRSSIAFSIFPDIQQSASGTPTATMTASGVYVSASSFSCPVDGPAKESITLVGNNKVWSSTNSTFSGGFLNTDSPFALTNGSGGIQRRQNILFDPTLVVGLDINGQMNATSATKCTILPPDVAGVTTSGTNVYNAALGAYGAAVQSINISANLGREAIYELGHKAPYYRFMNVPVEVTTEIEVISRSGDFMSGTEAGIYANGNNTRQSTIKLATQEGLFIDLGTKNQCNNVSIGGGDTGGGNQTITYSFITYNYYTVTHPQDPTGGLAA